MKLWIEWMWILSLKTIQSISDHALRMMMVKLENDFVSRNNECIGAINVPSMLMCTRHYRWMVHPAYVLR